MKKRHSKEVKSPLLLLSSAQSFTMQQVVLLLALCVALGSALPFVANPLVANKRTLGEDLPWQVAFDEPQLPPPVLGGAFGEEPSPNNFEELGEDAAEAFAEEPVLVYSF